MIVLAHRIVINIDIGYLYIADDAPGIIQSIPYLPLQFTEEQIAGHELIPDLYSCEFTSSGLDTPTHKLYHVAYKEETKLSILLCGRTVAENDYNVGSQHFFTSIHSIKLPTSSNSTLRKCRMKYCAN